MISSTENGVYAINDSVKMYNVGMNGDEVTFDVDYNDSEVTSEQAIAMCEDFLKKAIQDALARSVAESMSTREDTQNATCNATPTDLDEKPGVLETNPDVVQ